MSWEGREAVQCSEVQGIMDNGHMGPPCEQTDICENITFPQLRWQEVIVLALHILLLVGDFWLIVEFQRFTSIFLGYHFVTHETVIFTFLVQIVSYL